MQMAAIYTRAYRLLRIYLGTTSGRRESLQMISRFRPCSPRSRRSGRAGARREGTEAAELQLDDPFNLAGATELHPARVEGAQQRQALVRQRSLRSALYDQLVIRRSSR